MDFRYDYHGMGEYLRGSAGLNDVLRLAARNTAGRAQAMAVAEAFDTGNYFRSIGFTAERGDDGRQGYVVTASDRSAVVVEFGNDKTHGQGLHILARAAEGSLG